MTPGRLSVRLAAVVIGSLVALGVFAVIPRDDERRPESAAAIRADLTRRWERWRRATVAFTETTVRTSGDQQLSDRADIAQRFPDRIVRDGDDISAEIGGRQIGCSPSTATAPARCLDSGASNTEARLAKELEEFRTLTSGSAGKYRLSRTGEGCFRLRHVVPEFRPRWGDRLDLCFDARTGVLRTEVTTTGPLTISVSRHQIRTDVDDTAFSLPATPS